MNIIESVFGKLKDGTDVKSYWLENGDIRVKVIEYGATIAAIEIPDKDGIKQNIVLGYNDLDGFVNDTFFIGATIGRYANRIADGKIDIDGTEYQLEINNDPNHLHGGSLGFHNAVWSSETIKSDEYVGVKLKHFSKDGEGNYPGNLKISVNYKLFNNRLEIDYNAESDAKTPVNITNHSYFNLDGSDSNLEHKLEINATFITPVNSNLIPTGEFKNVSDTVFDFKKSKAVGKDITSSDEQLKITGGYDHNFVLDKSDIMLKKAASVFSNKSGIRMDLYCTQPGIQFYSGNFLEGCFKCRSALCLEPQYFPDSPNKENFEFEYCSPDSNFEESIHFCFSNDNKKVL
ncbi:MAG: galactose mutarotase [Melioribacteraceae bacterium]|nr:galactose mutarotase [Melioribacteraceae bacterium]